jgi:tetratricopeptide (TPR) repeat protein
MQTGNRATDRAYREEGIALARKLGDRRCLALALAGPGATREQSQESLALFRELDDRWGTIHQLLRVGELAAIHGDADAARPLYEEALQRSRELGHKVGTAWALDVLAELAILRGDLEAARRSYQECLAIARDVEHKMLIFGGLIGLGKLDRARGAWSEARARYQKCLVVAQQLGKAFTADALRLLGSTAYAEGDGESARAYFHALWQVLPLRGAAASCLEELAGVASAQCLPERAARLLGAVEGCRKASGATSPCFDCSEHERRVAAARGALGEEAFAAAWTAGQAMSAEQALAYALEDPSLAA